MRWTGTLLVIITLNVLGQVSQEGRFSVDYHRGCAPLTINVTEHDGFGAIDRQYFYENSTTVTTSLTHTYEDPGTYTLVQLIGIDVDPKTDTLIIEVFEPILPEYSYELCDDREVLVTIEDEAYDTYGISFASNTETFVSSGQSATYTFAPTEDPTIDIRGYKSDGADNCGEVNLLLPGVIDDLTPPTISNLQLAQSCEDQYFLQINAENILENVTYELEVQIDQEAFEAQEVTDWSSTLILSDFDFSSQNQTICARINAINACDGARVFGTAMCDDDSEASPILNLYSTYQGNDILIALDETDVGTYEFRRSYNGTSFPIVGTSSSSYLDQSGFSGRQYFYQVSYLDTCGGTWATQRTSPPFVKSNPLETNRFEITFSPAAHQLSSDFSYQATLSGIGSEDVEISGNIIDLRLSPTLGEVQYLTVQGVLDDLTIYSNTLRFEFEFIVYAPKAFTPNGDGLNDVFEIYGLGGATANFIVFNRWGQTIYSETSDSPSWDGRLNGKLLDEGVYLYEISIPEMSNHSQKGTFVLIKN